MAKKRCMITNLGFGISKELDMLKFGQRVGMNWECLMNLEDEVLEIALFSEGAELRRDGGRPWRGSLRVFQFSNIHSTDGSEVKNYVRVAFPELDGPPPVPDSFGLFFKGEEIITSEGADPPILEEKRRQSRSLLRTWVHRH